MIVYVGGYGRSGSTLLDRLLSRMSGVQGLGEFAFLPDLVAEGASVNCSCGEAVSSCTFWQGVIEEVGPTVSAIGGTQRSLRLVRDFEGAGALWFPWGRWRGAWATAYSDLTMATLAAVRHRLPGANVLVDSSKTARLASARPLALARVSGEEIRMLHLIRDGRAILWSALRGDNRLLERGIATVPRGVALRTLLGALHANLAALVVRARLRPGKVLLVNYEALVGDPDAELARIARFIGVTLPPDWREAVETINHRFAGNRNRLEAGITIIPDDEWKVKLGMFHRVLWRVLGWPVEVLVRWAGRDDR